MLHVTDPGNLDLNTFAQWISGLGAPALLALGIAGFIRNWVYTRATYEAMRTQLQGQIDAKDAALIRKDQQIQELHDQNASLNKGMLDVAVPALARAALIMEKFHTDTTVRRSE